MPKSPMMRAKIAMIEFKPNVLFRLDRKSPQDKYFKGPKSDYFNDLMKHLNLNATLVKSKTFGNCHVSNNCTGLYSMVQKGKADFSLLIIPYYFAPGIIYGPYGYPQTTSMLSLPIADQSYTRLDLLQIFSRTSFLVYFILAVLLLSLYIILNVTRTKRSKISMFVLFSSFINYFSLPRPRLLHTTLIMLFFFFLITFLTRIIFCSIDSNLIKINPAKYYESLDEVLQAAQKGKSQVYCLKNMRAHSAMMNRHENVYKQLLVHMKHLTRPEIWKLAKIMAKEPTVLLEIQSMIGIVEGLFCGWHKDLYLKLRKEPFLVAHTALTMNSNISYELQERASKVFSRAFETDRHMQHFRQMKLMSMVSYNITKRRLFNCEFELEYTRYLQRVVSKVHSIDFDDIYVLIMWLIGLWSLALFIHYYCIFTQLMTKTKTVRVPRTKRSKKLRESGKKKVKLLRERLLFTPTFQPNTRPWAEIYLSMGHPVYNKRPLAWSIHTN